MKKTKKVGKYFLKKNIKLFLKINKTFISSNLGPFHLLLATLE